MIINLPSISRSVYLDRSETSINGDNSSVDFTYYPNVTTTTEPRTQEHDVIGGDSVIQSLGTGPREIECVGTVTETEKGQLETLVDNHEYLDFYSDAYEDTIVVTMFRTQPLDGSGGVRDGSWLYEFTLRMRGVDEIVHQRDETDDDDVPPAGGGGG